MIKRQWFDCSECDYHTESMRVIERLKHTKYGDSLCPKCGCEGVQGVETAPNSAKKERRSTSGNSRSPKVPCRKVATDSQRSGWE